MEREQISNGGRFVVSMNKAENKFSLEISGVRVDDTATYYCKAQYKYGCSSVWKDGYADGSGTEVIVTAGSFSQSVTQTPAAVTRKECQSLIITCVFHGNSHHLQYGHFFRQTQAGTERERISSGGRFVVSMNKAESIFSLEIRDARVEDTATYYCKAQYKYGCGSVWEDGYADGSGTELTVTAGSSLLIFQNPPLQTSAVGDTVTLSCEYSGICQYTVHWYRQSPGQAPEYLLQRHTSGEENKENAAGERISASIDSAEKMSRLNIFKLQLSDSAVYYCALSRPTAHTKMNQIILFCIYLPLDSGSQLQNKESSIRTEKEKGSAVELLL
ncbi:Down syndrome cell adhesion molecule-like protein 1 homolog [Carcharodon carcharias]|uniref:Down syndrome cell adhesion molecule-like protein 1 homolog n=1 Tax=Carcharodon carcharias TaxID=13397 RepID=UPI001B7F6A10|nr:Down syndrome cell adhesion molecule-like protein 1 homolog [Carcharodon carcharias]